MFVYILSPLSFGSKISVMNATHFGRSANLICMSLNRKLLHDIAKTVSVKAQRLVSETGTWRVFSTLKLVCLETLDSENVSYDHSSLSCPWFGWLKQTSDIQRFLH